MTEQRNPEQLAAWIRANRSAYTREALDGTALGQGWSPDELAAAWRLVEETQPPVRWAQPAAGAGRTSDVRTQQILLLVLLAPITALALLFEASFGPLASGTQWTPVLILGMAVTIAIPVIAFIAVSRSVLPVGCAGLVGVVLVVGVAVFGTCLVTLSFAGMP